VAHLYGPAARCKPKVMIWKVGLAHLYPALLMESLKALNVLSSPVLFYNRQIIFERAATLRLPAMYEWPIMAEEGGFVAYGANLTQLYRDIYDI
jgi:hypothetical protein